MANWKEAFDNPFLSSYDIDGPVHLTISYVEQKMVQLTKLEKKNVAYFKETKLPSGAPTKPMILNSTNCKMIHNAVRSGNVDNWNNIQIELSVKANKGRIGDKQGLSINRILGVDGSASSTSNSKVELQVGSENWNKVLEYVKANKQLGLAAIINKLQARYDISTQTKKELGKYVE